MVARFDKKNSGILYKKDWWLKWGIYYWRIRRAYPWWLKEITVHEDPIKDPITEKSKEDPVTEKPKEIPITEDPKVDPVTNNPKQKSVTKDPTENPITEHPQELQDSQWHLRPKKLHLVLRWWYNTWVSNEDKFSYQNFGLGRSHFHVIVT